MAGSFTLPTVLANLTAGNQALSLIDADLDALANPLLALATFSNYYTDIGAANAYAITVSSPQTVAQSAGLRVQFIAANVNTGASTLQINALAVKNIKNLDGTAVLAGQIPAAGIVDVIYDGTQYLLLNPATARGTFTVTLTGFTAGVTGTAAYSVTNNVVTLFLPVLTGTSNTTAMTATGAPAAIQPATAHLGFCVVGEDNTAVSSAPARADVATSGVITFYTNLGGSAWTNSGTKGLPTGMTITYNLN